MLSVISNKDANELVKNNFNCLNEQLNKFTYTHKDTLDILSLKDCLYAKLNSDIVAKEGVPAFDRSTMDGYAVRANDTFGSSEAIPALLKCIGNIHMGKAPDNQLKTQECMEIATGGMLPKEADAVVMKEYCHKHNDGTIEIQKPVAPGENVIFKNDDIKPGEVLIKSGQILLPHHIGTIASLGISNIDAYKHIKSKQALNKTKIAVISTGDELVDITSIPKLGEIRDVNTYVLQACIQMCGCEPVLYGIVKDEYSLLSKAFKDAIDNCDCVLVSGGSSVGQRDNTVKVMQEYGEILFHGLSIKPGKPTILAKIKKHEKQIAAFGLPGHPVASYFVFLDIVASYLCDKYDKNIEKIEIDKSISSNNGRTEYIPVKIYEENGEKHASPIFIKSGLISLLSKSDGYIIIEKDSEGAKKGEMIDYIPWLKS